MSFFHDAAEGIETRLAIPVNVATDARYRGQGMFSALQARTSAAASGSPLTVTFPNAKSYPIFVRGSAGQVSPASGSGPAATRSRVVRCPREAGEQADTQGGHHGSQLRYLEVRPIERFGVDGQAR